MLIVFIGPPGSGKGTQCRRLAAEIDAEHLSTGQMLRETQDGSELGRRVSGYIDDGGFAPDELVMQLITGRLESPGSRPRVLLDGFPRNVTQAELLAGYLDSRGLRLDAVIILHVSPAESLARLLERGKTENRPDDHAAAIERRLEIYHARTEPLVGYYSRAGIIHNVDADRSMADVQEQIQSIVGSMT